MPCTSFCSKKEKVIFLVFWSESLMVVTRGRLKGLNNPTLQKIYMK